LDWFVGGSSGADVRRDWRRVADVRDAWADEEDEEEGEEEEGGGCVGVGSHYSFVRFEGGDGPA